MYYYFQKVLAWVREVLARMFKAEDTKLKMNLELILTPRIAYALNKWSLMYINLAPWTTQEDGITSNGVLSLNLAAAISSELARSVTIDMKCEVTGSERADYLQAQIERVLTDIRTYTEYACAKGGLVFKPYVLDDEIRIDFVQADMFYPLAFSSNGKLTACVFVDVKQEGSNFYKRFEYHSMQEDGEHIKNWAFKSQARDMLGDPVPLTSVVGWEDIEPEAVIEGVDRPLFAYFRMPFANNIDPMSPIGVACFARSVDIIEATDRMWTNFLWEFESGERALYVDSVAFKKDPRTGLPMLPNRRLYRTLDMGGQDDDFFKDWSPNLREMSFINGIESNYRMIEFQCGLSDGVLPRPAPVQVATATEIKMTQQRSYSTVSDVQKSLRTAMEDLLYAIDAWTSLYELAPEGDYEASYTFDDSLVRDKDSEFNQNSQALGLKVMGRVEFRMRQYGETKEAATKAIAEADADTPSGFFDQEARDAIPE